MKNVAHHTLDIYDVEVYLPKTRKAWKRLRKSVSFIGEYPRSAGLSTFAVKNSKRRPSCGHLVLWLDLKKLSTPELVNTIAHEAAHGTGAILDWAGVNVNGGDNEAHAYLVGWLSQWMWENVNQETSDG